MFRLIGHISSRYWPLMIVGWGVLLLFTYWYAPEWHAIVVDSEFQHIPEDMPSRQGERLFKQSFSRDLLGSSVVLVLRREHGPNGLREDDRRFIRDTLTPALETIQKKVMIDPKAPATPENRIVYRILTFDDPAIGELLVSDDGKAALVILQLRTEFLAKRNQKLVERIEELISHRGVLQTSPDPKDRIPVGLDISLSGTAAVGRDMGLANDRSIKATHIATVVLVVLLLLLIYRAPFLVLIPMLTVAVSVTISLRLLAIMADAGWVQLFAGVKIYVQVVMYGAGVDYCMFLMARYKEELDTGNSYAQGMANAVRKVGSALAASAGTTMAGIGMMIFAEFGKFREAGVALTFSLAFVLAAALTLAPGILRLFGKWAFWPQVRSDSVAKAGGWLSPTSLFSRLLQSHVLRDFWTNTGRKLRKRPGTIWIVTFALMLPFAVVGLWNQSYLSYGLLSELPANDLSVVGSEAVQKHFPAGATGPVTILLKSRKVQFAQSDTPEARSENQEGLEAIRILARRLEEKQDELRIADIRSLAHPRGITPAAERAREQESALLDQERRRRNIPESGPQYAIFLRKFNQEKQNEKLSYYVSDKGDLANHVTRIDIVFMDDPFSRDMLERLDETKETVRRLLPAELKGAELYFIGPTASMRDLKTVTNRDQIRIDVLCVLAVFTVLLILLRRPAISGYLILTVVLSYLVALGATFAFFWMLDPSGFAGLDWKVPIFLFTILIAVGEDYNIYLITRIDEEQERHGPTEGITVALAQTGSIISGCGIIMAGTFASLAFGSLAGLQQLGFALAFGVLLDTFVVRPVLVPAYLLVLNSGRFGALGRFLGAKTNGEETTESSDDEAEPPRKLESREHPVVSESPRDKAG